jgi:transposase-like protein
MDKEKSVDGQELIRLIDGHSEGVKNRTITCAATVCCHCGLDAASSQTPFILHGDRARRFLVVVGSYVCKVAALLARWRCPRCRKTFTDYPSFAYPYKAYTLPQITERAAKYVSNTATSYRKGVRLANLPIFYAQ